jgi:DNA-binding response OmpR family regulator
MLLLDVMLPGRQRLSTSSRSCAAARSSPTLPIVLLTAKAELKDIRNGLAPRRRRLHHQAL